MVFVCVAAIIFLSHYSIPDIAKPSTLAIIVFMPMAFFYVRFTLQSVIMLAVAASLIFYTFVNCCFVPVLMQYQAGSEAASFWISGPINDRIVMLDEDSSCSFDFYAPGEIAHIPIDQLAGLPLKPAIFCHEKFIDSLNVRQLQTEVWKAFPFYKVSQPSEKFMNHATRERFPERYVIVKIN